MMFRYDPEMILKNYLINYMQTMVQYHHFLLLVVQLLFVEPSYRNLQPASIPELYSFY